MKKTISFFLSMAIVTAVLASCSDEKDDYEIETRQPVVESSLEGYEQKALDLHNYNLDNDEDTEAEISFFWFEVAGSDYGYYFWNEDMMMKEYLMFYDKSSGKSVPLCNRPECDHNSNECNAYYSMDNGDNDIVYDRYYLQFYDGHLYMLAYDREGYMCLYKISEDGNVREQYMKLYKQDLSVTGEADTTLYSSPEICIHKGYIYYIDTKESVPKLRRMKLGSDNAEVVFELNGEKANMYRILPYGDYVFFQAGIFNDDSYKNVDGGIFAYNVQTGELQLVKKGVISTYEIYDEKIYYADADGIYTFDLLTCESKKTIDRQGYSEFSVDSQYIYLFEEGVLEVYSRQGQHICNIEDELVRYCYYGDEEYLFATGSDEEMNSFTAVLKISDIAVGNAKWQYIK